MSFLDEHAPWGSPVDPTIPLPPFADEAQHARFTRKLQLHLALIDGPARGGADGDADAAADGRADGGPDAGGLTLPTIALSVALDRRWRRPTADDDPRWLTPLELSVSLTTWFPAPWTPTALAAALHGLPDAPTSAARGAWDWLHDPEFFAKQTTDGGWKVQRHERGSVSTEQIASDRDLVVLWMSHFREKFGFPLAGRYDDAELADLAAASLAVLDADAKDAAYPYRESWRADRSAALAAARNAGGARGARGAGDRLHE